MQFTTTSLATLLLALTAAASPIGDDVVMSSRDAPNKKIPCVTTSSRKTVGKGDGNPHQNFVFKQVSGTTDCTDNPSGSASITNSQSVTYTESINAAVDFITLGFSVAESTSTGYTNAFGCGLGNGATLSGDLCVFERIQVTAYTVNAQECFSSSCGASWCSSPSNEDVVIYAPNKDQPGCFYDNHQLNLPCSGLGTEHQVWAGPAGGPQSISCQPAYPPAAP